MSKCLGCGIELQNISPQDDGYVTDLSYVICERCFMIKNYGENKVVKKSNTSYMAILDEIKANDIVVYVSSLLTLNLDYIGRFKKIILVLTKRDLLPKSVNDNKIINYIKKRYDNILKIIIVSAYKKYNLDLLYNELNNYKNKKIYFVGLTNSGKSTLLNAMTKSYNGYKGDITVSNYPATTLGVIPVEIGKLKIKDTPGVIIRNSIINYLNDKEIKKINYKKEIKPVTIQVAGDGAILVDEFMRIEYSGAGSMTFYMSNNLNIDNISFKNPRLLDYPKREIIVPGSSDLVIEDMGFIKVTKEIKLTIYVGNDIYMYVRDKLI